MHEKHKKELDLANKKYNDLKKSKKFAAAFKHYSLVHQDHYDSQLANHESAFYSDGAGQPIGQAAAGATGYGSNSVPNSKPGTPGPAYRGGVHPHHDTSMQSLAERLLYGNYVTDSRQNSKMSHQQSQHHFEGQHQQPAPQIMTMSIAQSASISVSNELNEPEVVAVD